MEKENILIIAKYMLPYVKSFGCCQRVYYLANHLSEKGMSVTVIGEKVGKRTMSLNTMERKYTSYWLRNKHNSEYSILNTRLFKMFSRIIFNEVAEPIAFQHYLWRIKNTEEIINCIKHKKIQKVIISGPPFSIFGLCEKIKRRYKDVKVILDYRDPWNLWNNAYTIASYLEYKQLQKCDKIVCFSNDFKIAMQKRFPLEDRKYEVIYNGYYEKAWREVNLKKRKNEHLIFKYIGSYAFPACQNNYRDLKELIDAFLSVSENRSMEIQFIGAAKITTQMKEIEKKSNGKIHFSTTVTVQESLEQMVNSDVLISIHDAKNQSDQFILSAKLFDYMRSGNFILNIGEKKSALSRFIKKNGVGISCENNKFSLEKTLVKLYDIWQKNDNCILRKNQNFNYERYSREYQNEKYLDLLKRI